METVHTKPKKKKIALFSGRFDPPHPGHIATITRLLRKYDKVKVPILWYEDNAYEEGRRFPATYAKAMLEEIFWYTNKVEFFINDTHFGKISQEEIKAYEPFDVYVSGNISVLTHIEEIGFDVEYIDRAYHYKASDMPCSND